MSATLAAWGILPRPPAESVRETAARSCPSLDMPPPTAQLPPNLRPRRALDSRSDEVLMEAFAHGDSAAFEPLVRRHSRSLYNFLLRSVQSASRAEELLQDVLMRVVRSKHRYRRSAKFTTWMYTIARNLCVDESRRARFRDHDSLDAPRALRGEWCRPLLASVRANAIPADEQTEGARLRTRLAAAVDGLPADQREVFLMRQLGGLSFREIGSAVGAPENTVKSRMRYALEKLRAELSELRESMSGSACVDARQAEGRVRG